MTIPAASFDPPASRPTGWVERLDGSTTHLVLTVGGSDHGSVRPATLLHTSDVHLGAGPGGIDDAEARAFSLALDLAMAEDVDAVLITGDLFDHARVSDELLDWTAGQLDRINRPVVLLVGNHDSLHNESVHFRFEATDRCDRVLMLDDLDGQIVPIPDTDVVVWGRAMVEHAPSFRPLADVPE